MQVLVIGAGVIGLAVARTAAVAGHEVTVAEMTGGIANGVSSRNSEVIECAVHMGAFHVPTGEVKAPPCAMALRTYKVMLDGDDILIDLDRNAAGELA